MKRESEDVMNILEFIESYYPIKQMVKDKLSDPYKRIQEMDNLPYDFIGPDEMGHLTKMVEVNDNYAVPVLDLIGYSETDFTPADEELYLVWKTYMSQVKIKDVNLVDIMECVRDYRVLKEKREKQLNVLSS